MNNRFLFFILPNSYIQVVYGLNIHQLYDRFTIKSRDAHSSAPPSGQNKPVTTIQR